MEFTAKTRLLRATQRKLGLVSGLARGKNVQDAINALQFNERRWSKELVALIRSAASNASQNRGVNVDRLYVKRLTVEKGPTLKRFMTRARGSGARILKRTSQVTVILDERMSD